MSGEDVRLKTAAKVAAGMAVLLALGACVAGSGDSTQAASGGLLSQFFLGLWHGFIGPLTLIAEVINRLAPHFLPWKVHFYEAKAEGAAYDVGFYLGLAGSPALVWSRRR
jgi:hypothetical protein